jgi:hypothetical protein
MVQTLSEQVETSSGHPVAADAIETVRKEIAWGMDCNVIDGTYQANCASPHRCVCCAWPLRCVCEETAKRVLAALAQGPSEEPQRGDTASPLAGSEA